MRSIRITLVAGALLASALAAPSASANSTPIPVHLLKDCSAFDGVAPTYCTISDSDAVAIPIGTKVIYLGPVLSNLSFLSSNVRLEAADGSSATGYCIFNGRSSLGLCTFWEGSGALTGFTAILDVTIDADKLWHLDGVYYFADDAKPVSATAEATPWVVVAHDGRPR